MLRDCVPDTDRLWSAQLRVPSRRLTCGSLVWHRLFSGISCFPYKVVWVCSGAPSCLPCPASGSARHQDGIPRCSPRLSWSRPHCLPGRNCGIVVVLALGRLISCGFVRTQLKVCSSHHTMERVKGLLRCAPPSPCRRAFRTADPSDLVTAPCTLTLPSALPRGASRVLL